MKKPIDINGIQFIEQMYYILWIDSSVIILYIGTRNVLGHRVIAQIYEKFFVINVNIYFTIDLF